MAHVNGVDVGVAGAVVSVAAVAVDGLSNAASGIAIDVASAMVITSGIQVSIAQPLTNADLPHGGNSCAGFCRRHTCVAFCLSGSASRASTLVLLKPTRAADLHLEAS